jgi:hypothetical protein
MRNKSVTKDFYIKLLGFSDISAADYEDYLLLKKDHIEIHFFAFKELDPKENYGQVYIRTIHIEALYKSLLENTSCIHPSGHLQTKPWGQKEFAVLDPDNNLLTFGQSV